MLLRRSLPVAALAAFLALAVVGCGGGSAPPSVTGQVAGRSHSLRNPACESNRLDGVHNPVRLKVLNPCAAFQGRVVLAPTTNPSDGDVTFVVSPDPGYAGMLNAHNRSEGGLHIEIVPRDQPGCTPGQPVHHGDTQGLGICSGRDIAGPALGAHIRIIGPWVLDTNDTWNEIHPAWSIGAPNKCRVPQVTGRTLQRARSVIAHSGCTLGKVSRRTSRKRLTGRVLTQRPSPGSLLRERTSISLSVGRGPRR